MRVQPIYLSTSAAASLAQVETHVLRNHYQRFGHWRGISPRKSNGRLAWPADQVQSVVLPDLDHWPEGMSTWLGHCQAVAPNVSALEAFRIGYPLLASEAVKGWKPQPGQLGEAQLKSDGALIAMKLQAWKGRVDEARAQRGAETVAQRAEEVISSICARLFQYAATEAGDE